MTDPDLAVDERFIMLAGGAVRSETLAPTAGDWYPVPRGTTAGQYGSKQLAFHKHGTVCTRKQLFRFRESDVSLLLSPQKRIFRASRFLHVGTSVDPRR